MPYDPCRPRCIGAIRVYGRGTTLFFRTNGFCTAKPFDSVCILYHQYRCSDGGRNSTKSFTIALESVDGGGVAHKQRKHARVQMGARIELHRHASVDREADVHRCACESQCVPVHGNDLTTAFRRFMDSLGLQHSFVVQVTTETVPECVKQV